VGVLALEQVQRLGRLRAGGLLDIEHRHKPELGDCLLLDLAVLGLDLDLPGAGSEDPDALLALVHGPVQLLPLAEARGPRGVRPLGHDQQAVPERVLAEPGLDARYAERMMVENELDAYISGFHLDALTSGVPLNIDLATTLTVVAGNLYRLLARQLSRYENATPRPDLAALPRRHRYPAHHRQRRDLRAEPPQPPPRPHRRRLR
jgi:hypothetical protein